MKLVLASQSPRRREILERAGFEFSIRVAGVPEEHVPGESPVDYVKRLSLAKAEAVRHYPDEIVLGADTVVIVDEHILEKPSSDEDAGRMLRLLSGREHSVVTGIALLHRDTLVQDYAETRVHFLPMNAREIDEYIASGEPMDKAGAYAIQGLASKFIDRISGCYFNVVGLPVSLVYRHYSAIASPSDSERARPGQVKK